MRKIVSFKYTRYLFVSVTSLFSADSSSSSANASAGGAVAEHSHGPVVGFVDDLLEPSCHTGFDDRAFGQAAADDAVAVLVAAPPTGTVGAGDVIPARPRARLQTLRPVRPSGLALVGREPHVAPDLPADRRGVAAEHQTDPADAGAVADLDLDDLAFLFRQVRIYFSHRCNIPSDWFSGQSPIQRVLHFQLDNG